MMKFRALWLLLCIFLLTGCQTKEPADTDTDHLSPPSDAAADSSAGNSPQNRAGELSSGQADNDIPLDLSENRIRDVSPLAPLLRQLDEIDVSYNEIEDLSPLGQFAQDGLSVAGNPGAES